MIGVWWLIKSTILFIGDLNSRPAALSAGSSLPELVSSFAVL